MSSAIIGVLNRWRAIGNAVSDAEETALANWNRSLWQIFLDGLTKRPLGRRGNWYKRREQVGVDHQNLYARPAYSALNSRKTSSSVVCRNRPSP